MAMGENVGNCMTERCVTVTIQDTLELFVELQDIGSHVTNGLQQGKCSDIQETNHKVFALGENLH